MPTPRSTRASKRRRVGRINSSQKIRNTRRLRFKKLQGHDRVWSVRINEQFRAVGERDGDTIEWAWIGSHNDFDNMFG